MAFVEVRYPETGTAIGSGGPEFVTFRTTTRSGAETAVAVWDDPRRHWDIDHEIMEESGYNDLFAFFVNRRGALDGFRFKDPLDYQLAAAVSTEQITSTTFQIVRPYTYGGVTVTQNLTKISGTTLTNTAATQANSTVRVWQVDGVTEVTSGWTVNLTTGVITFSGAPGYVPKVTCEFDFPVRFDVDRLPTNYLNFMRGATQVRLIEMKFT